MRGLRTGSMVVGVLVAGFTAIAQAQRAAPGTAPFEWLPAAAARSNMFTLVVVDDRTGQPVVRPLVCPDDPPGWVIGGEDGRVVYGGSPPDTLRWRVLGPRHEAREIKVPWLAAKGRVARLILRRRAEGETNPSCDAEWALLTTAFSGRAHYGVRTGVEARPPVRAGAAPRRHSRGRLSGTPSHLSHWSPRIGSWRS